jgi:acylphosphatase
VPVRRHVVVDGRVQGVWFRDSCLRLARAAGLTGWVRNRPDGRVEAVFEGEPEAVEGLVSWCRHGPPRAVVTGIEVRDEPLGDEADFRMY